MLIADYAGVWVCVAVLVAFILALDTDFNDRRNARTNIWIAATWPLQIIWIVLHEAYKRLTKKTEKDPGWKERAAPDARRLLEHQKYPIVVFLKENGGLFWGWQIGRHSGEVKSSANYYTRLEYCKEDALEAYFQWELERAQKLEQC